MYQTVAVKQNATLNMLFSLGCMLVVLINKSFQRLCVNCESLLQMVIVPDVVVSLNLFCFVFQSMRDSTVVEMSEDEAQFRPAKDPQKWPIIGPQISFTSPLNVDVPEFVPGKAYQLTTSTTGEYLLDD